MLLKSVSETLELWVIIRTPTGIGPLGKRPEKTHFGPSPGVTSWRDTGRSQSPGVGPDRTMAMSNPMTGWDHKGIYYAAGHFFLFQGVY